MSDKNTPLSEKKQSMLAELESIKSLLDDELDNIPVLQETVIEEDGVVTIAPLQSLADLAALSDSIQNEEIATSDIGVDVETETEVLYEEEIHQPAQPQTIKTANNVLPGQQALFKEPPEPKKLPKTKHNQYGKKSLSPQEKNAQAVKDRLLEKQAKKHKQPSAKNTTPNNNPFLPEHIRHRLNGASNAAPEDPFIATLQQPQQSQPVNIQVESHSNVSARQKLSNENDIEQMVEQIIAHYMPKIESDLRQKLRDTFQQKHNNTNKNT